LAGAVGDRFGARKILILGIALFGGASLLCAAAPNLPLLLAARALQGTGAACVLPNSLAILGGTFSGKARGGAVGTWSAASAIAAAIGPVVGGTLIDAFGWRTIFLINIPLAAVAAILALGFVRDAPRSAKDAPLDAWGALLVTVGLSALIWGLTSGGGPAGWSLSAVLCIALGAALMLTFIAVERALGDRAMMPLAMFASQDFVGLSVLTLLLYGAFSGLLTLLPYILIRGAGYSGTAAGAALLPFPVVLALVSRTMGALAGRIGTRRPLIAGPLLVAVGFVLLLRLAADSGYWNVIVPAVLVLALGMGASAAPLTTAVLSSVDTQHEGAASGFNSAVSRTGGLVTMALIGFVFAAHGDALYAAFHIAMLAFAVASLGAAAAAWLWLGRR
jgi:EmrB/QacA subfamily drug resistance transporter